jgi:transposase-like protein
VRKVARDFDIHSNLVHQWKRMFMTEGDGAFVGTGNLTEELREQGSRCGKSRIGIM